MKIKCCAPILVHFLSCHSPIRPSKREIERHPEATGRDTPEQWRKQEQEVWEIYQFLAKAILERFPPPSSHNAIFLRYPVKISRITSNRPRCAQYRYQSIPGHSGRVGNLHSLALEDVTPKGPGLRLKPPPRVLACPPKPSSGMKRKGCVALPEHSEVGASLGRESLNPGRVAGLAKDVPIQRVAALVISFGQAASTVLHKIIVIILIVIVACKGLLKREQLLRPRTYLML